MNHRLLPRIATTRTVIACTALLCVSARMVPPVCAQTRVTVHLNNGLSHNYALETTGGIDLTTEGLLAIHESNISGTTATFSTGAIRKLTFSRDAAGMETASTDVVTAAPNPTSGRIVLRGLPQGVQAARIYTAAGQLAETCRVEHDGTLDLSRLPQGIYILQAGERRMKIVKL